MLSDLSIENFAIIEKLRLRFVPGFNVLTGETGAGKSIIIDAVSAVLGGRVGSDQVRSGADSAHVEGIFILEPQVRAALNPLLQENGLQGDGDETLILAREIRASGRTIARVNGRAVTVGLLREIGERLVDIHGQSEHLSLLRTREHRRLLDRYGGLEAQRQAVAKKVRELRRVRQELKSLQQDERELARRADLLNYQVDEIASARLEIGEEEELIQERARLEIVRAGVGLQKVACAGLMELYRRWEKPERTEQVREYLRGLRLMSSVYTSLDKRIWDLHGAPDGTRGLHPGDIFNLVANHQDRAVRVEATLALGVVKLTCTRRGDRKMAQRLIRRMLDSEDPIERAAARSAQALDAAGLERLARG